jgi:hypothetical protein
MTTLTITWKAFANSHILSDRITSATINVAPVTPSESVYDLLSQVFHDTNTYNGKLWELLQPVLPDNRTHTALSVGDEVTINNRTFRCAPIGWDEIQQENN